MFIARKEDLVKPYLARLNDKPQLIYAKSPWEQSAHQNQHDISSSLDVVLQGPGYTVHMVRSISLGITRPFKGKNATTATVLGLKESIPGSSRFRRRSGRGNPSAETLIC